MEKRLQQLKQGLKCLQISLSEEILLRELVFLDELSRWSVRINLTAIRNQQQALEKHLIDSLVLVKHCPLGRLLDVGSGAGIPAIPLAIAQPQRQVCSVESVGKKVNFQRHMRRHLQLDNFEPFNSRVEDLKPPELFPLITARAFASVGKIIQLVHPLLATDGELILLCGSKDESCQVETANALKVHGFKVRETIQYRLPFSQAQRQILKISRN
ncbi:MAG: 16S rRNA (guanine(527)-N(7))-methyltransferase RsmG [Geopsychrobacter sp.]|nr:16S rRNA (guanine(527)-N(7))-methyltransferase RsmG [Geopsychrobacter sp.]